MFYYLTVLSFLIYGFLVAKIFSTSLLSSMTAGHVLVSILKFLVIAFLFYEIWTEWRVYLSPKKADLLQRRLTKQDAFVFLSVFLGVVFSYSLNHTFALGAVVASSLVGLIGSLLFPALAVPIYCGSFAGMVSNSLASGMISVVTIGFFSGLLYVSGTETFKGFGGKLGATAYFATLLSSLFFDTFRDTMTGGTIVLQYDVFVVFVIGSLGTYLINAKYQMGVVTASSLLGITFGLLLPNTFSNGYSLSVALFCGTFIGMSTTSKLSTRVSVLIASVIGTIIYLYTSPYFAGLGGKLGLIAFGSTIAASGIYNFRAVIGRRL